MYTTETKPKDFSANGHKVLNLKEGIDFPSSGITGADMLKKAVEKGPFKKPPIITINHKVFCCSKHHYKGKVVLVNSSIISVPTQAKMPGTILSHLPNNPYVILQPQYVEPFLQIKN